MNIKVLFKKRIHGTFVIKVVNFKSQEVSDWYCQFSFKDPWLLPKYDPAYGKSKCPLYGWLFFYFGRTSTGMVTRIKEDDAHKHKSVIRDKNGNPYLLYGIEGVKLRSEFGKIARTGKFKFTAKIQPDGKAEIIAKVR